jgi:hypothetical protein
VDVRTVAEAGAPATPGQVPPDGVLLFDGSSFDQWQPQNGNGAVAWELPGDGTMVVVPGTGSIRTRQVFNDLFVHAEYKTPPLPNDVTGQDRGNSGIYLNNRYEIQILDSFGLPPATNGCGAIYEFRAPNVTACHEQDVWNTYEIEFRAARWDEQGNKIANAHLAFVRLNGLVLHEEVDVPDSTGMGESEVPGPRALVLQEHDNRVAFRNVWVIPR